MLKHSEKLNGLIKYTVAAILLGVPLYPKFPLINVPGTFVAIRLEDLLIAFAGLLLVFALLPRIKEFWSNSLIKTIFLFLAVGLVSLASAVLVTKTVTPHIGFLHWARRVEYFIPLFLGMEAIRRDRTNIGFYFKVMLITLFFAFVYGVGQRYFNWPIIITQNAEYSKGVALRWIPGSHINSTFAGHYDLATYLVMFLPIVVSAIFVLKGIRTKVMLVLLWIFGLWLLVVAASRISLFSYLVASSFSLFLVKKYKVIPIVAIISIAFIGFSSNLLDRYVRLFQVSFDRVNEVIMLNDNLLAPPALAQDGTGVLERRGATPTPTPVPVFEDRSTSIRFNVEWPRAIRALKKNPLLGTGYSSITLATDNDYLRLLGEVGLLGFLAFSLLFFKIGKKFLFAWPFGKKYDKISLLFIAGMAGALPGLFINAVFIDIFEASKFATLFWLMMGFTLSLMNYGKTE